MGAVAAARGLLQQHPAHRVVSLYLDLDPERFATPPARASQIRSLLDQARRRADNDTALGHEERMALREDLHRIDSYLHSPEAPYKGARALAVFCSIRDGLFEVVQLKRPIEARVVIKRSPYVEPLLAAADERRWCVVLVSRGSARVLTGPGDELRESERSQTDIRAQYDQSEGSQANYERSYENDVDEYLRWVAAQLERRRRRERFERLAIGGPVEIVPRFERMLSDELRSLIVDGRVDVDVAVATESQIGKVVAAFVTADEQAQRRSALDRLAARLGRGERASAGPEATLAALNERRVETLLLNGEFERTGGRCPSCGLLSTDAEGTCPADGTALEAVDLREASVEAALSQDADTIVIADQPDLGPFQGIAALHRF
jgi:peptide subunit release factor 1 (eRF1)